MNIFKKILIVTFISILTLKFSDILFNNLYDPPAQPIQTIDKMTNRYIVLRENKPNIDVNFTPSQNALDDSETLKDITYYLKTDDNGFIKNGNNQISKLKKNDVKIIFFGGSTTESLFVKESVRFPSLLEKNLREKIKKNIYVYNAGVSGNNSLHSLLNLISKGISIKPNFVVLMNNMNDLGSLKFSGSYWKAPLSRSIIKKSEEKTIFRLIFNETKDFLIPNLYNFIRPRIQFNRNVKSNDEWAEFRNNKIDYDSLDSMYSSSIKSFIRVSRAWDIEPILMTQFNRVNSTDPLWQKTFLKYEGNYKSNNEYINKYHQFNEIIRQIAKDEKVSLIDLAVVVPRNNDFIYDVVHLNENGSKLVANVLTDFFLKKLRSKSNLIQ